MMGNTFEAIWSNKQKTGAILFTKNSLKKAVKYLLGNCYFKLGNKIFRQIIGIPVGSNPAPLFANLFFISL